MRKRIENITGFFATNNIRTQPHNGAIKQDYIAETKAILTDFDRELRQKAVLKCMLFLEANNSRSTLNEPPLPKELTMLITFKLYSDITEDCFFPLEQPNTDIKKEETHPEKERCCIQ